MSTKLQILYTCCTATKCNVYYTKSQKCTVWETNLRRNPMFDFTKQTKQYEELAERIKQVNEFWINSIISSFKQFIK